MAIGTLATVVYALFRDVVLLPRRRAKLELRFDRTGTDQVIIGTADGVEAASVRVRVANGRGKDTADEVVVVVTELVLVDDSATTPIGLPLTWSGTHPPLTMASVHPGSQRHVDLLHVDWPAQNDAPLRLDVSPKPRDSRDALEPGNYEISIEVRARNADATRYVVPVSWDGAWPEKDAIWDHVRVEPPRPTS
ncbi:MAG TPA: hypothetical protein VKB64_04355 [Gaiellaceae bacterium]|nr:hypothetical protein [Gaiellaceae bacterium]